MRPDRVVFITATGTGTGKTWLTARLLRAASLHGIAVAARKPAQSFDPSAADSTDATVLAAAAACSVTDVCPTHRWYPLPLAPPMAATQLGRPPYTIADLLGEMTWPFVACEPVSAPAATAAPEPSAPRSLGVVEGAGGLRSPIASDGDNLDLAVALDPDVVVLVADAGLGTINAVRLNVAALAGKRTIVFLNRFSEANRVHVLNRRWLIEVDGLVVATTSDELGHLIGIRAAHQDRAATSGCVP